MTRKIFETLLPIMFPMAIPLRPFLAADRETLSSGNEVPRAMTLNPIKVLDIPKKSPKNIV